MAERLTTRFHGILVKEADVSKIQVITKLGQLEDIMEEYNIKTISQLQARLSGEDKSHKNAVVWRNKYDELKKQMQNIMDKYGIESVEELEKKLADSDTWQKACELASEREDDCYVYDNIHRAYEFYQQAKKEGNDE